MTNQTPQTTEEETHEVILYDSVKAAWPETVKCWRSGDGRLFLPGEEDFARRCGATHKECDCGMIMSKWRRKCETCENQKAILSYEEMPYQKWDGIGLLYSDKLDSYFHSEKEALETAYDWQLPVGVLRLIICEPVYATEIDIGEQWIDYLPEDMGIEDVSPELNQLAANVNTYISEHKPILSWIPGKYRTDVPDWR